MKKFAFLLTVIVIISLLFAGCAEGQESVRALNVSDIQSDPFSFVGEITLTGVVGAFSQYDLTLLGLLDTDEILSCGNLNCGAYMQYVRYIGDQPLPKLADEITIIGSFVNDPQISEPLFLATSFEVKRNVMHIITN